MSSTCTYCKGKGSVHQPKAHWNQDGNPEPYRGEYWERQESNWETILCPTCKGTGVTNYTRIWVPEKRYSCTCNNGYVNVTVVTERWPSGMTKNTRQEKKRCTSCNGTGVHVTPGHYEDRYDPLI